MSAMTHKRGPGRPALPETEVRNILVNAMVTPAEAEEMRKDAASLGLSLSSYLRQAMLEKLKRSRDRKPGRGDLSVIA